MVYIPSSTYRVQLSPQFTLRDLKNILPYLRDLGISTIYAAPFFTARPGSEHGYDVTDPHQINPEVGTMEELQEIAEELKAQGMGWLQDIVPNHMAFHPNNAWLMDVLEKGQKSRYYTFFDVNFSHPDFEGQLMVPFLGGPLEEVVKAEQLKVTFDEHGFRLNYFDNIYPISIDSYTFLLARVAEKLSSDDGKTQLAEQVQKLEQLMAHDKLEPNDWKQTKEALYQTAQRQPDIKQGLATVLQGINEDESILQKLLGQQYYILSHWQETEKKINYRRFFTVNDLICTAMEREEVFTHYHQFIKELCMRQLVQGLRVDHVDGLFDPDKYLTQLRELAGEQVYLVVEKILEGEENMPDYWPIQGNSGYDFLAWVSNLYTDAEGERKLTQVYRRLVPGAPLDYEGLVYEKKLLILENYMQGELQSLLRLLRNCELLPASSVNENWHHALATLLASFPVYRIYGHTFPLMPEAMEVVDKAFAIAYEKAPNLKAELEHLRTLFESGNLDSEEQKRNKLYFVMRSQQFTGPLAAKGVEDTTFYNYNRLLALNEVGNSPDVFNLDRRDFHERMQYRMHIYPHSINATATHDTKRGEGSRMRLQVLSELPEEWEENAKAWIQLAQRHSKADGPTANDLYFILQTLLGVMPIDGQVDDTLVERVQEYLVKAFREAKVNTNWSEPNEGYEAATKDLVKKLLQEDKEFMASFLPFFRKTAHFGWIYSLCQTLLKTTCPGVPDVYQGCEFWDFSLVDPDNRRPVDYELRQQFLQEIRESKQPEELLQQVLLSPTDARVKLYLLHQVLHLRKAQKELFDRGVYIPLQLKGKHSKQAMAFARRHEENWCLVVVPRLLTTIISENELPLGEQVWGDTSIELPAEAPQEWQLLFGGQHIQAKRAIPLAEIFKSFPVALLTSTKL
ncbi:malto-oligosyltrehalose synthase [Pontibacter sp. HSC-36F09]|uniref:malto-oligosyltrehalose synthase n=1 Tax=Pontibacter sp. HSC-36F09 TaxID=2910966 RepID=UPI0020A161F2|nr:malto-oligosyltrehalose synthase [Pontibacter sp. HSC-36F09]MCP2045450.1 (1->4)-alpha-D-glucan 1-alpha-D-glucosylmutase [Pontibacter sp. HSC-36F09]